MEKTSTMALQTVPDDLTRMFGKIRKKDREEVNAVTLRSADAALVHGLDSSVCCWTVFHDGEPIAVFGVTRSGLLSNKGVPWMLSTDGVLKVRRTYVRHTKEFIREMFLRTGFDYLENWVAADNLVSIKWLRWSGFHVGEPQPYGFKGESFCRFWASRKEVLSNV